MIPDLGEHSTAILASYGLSIALLVGIVALSIWRSRRVRAQLEQVEKLREANR